MNGTSSWTIGRGPTKLISPFKTLKICGNSSKLVLLKNSPIGVKNGKSFPCYKFRSMCVDAKQMLEKYLRENPEARMEWERG